VNTKLTLKLDASVIRQAKRHAHKNGRTLSAVVLDLLLAREPHYRAAVQLFALIEEKKLDGYVSSLICANLYYLLRKAKTGRTAKAILQDLKSLLKILPVTEKTIGLALASEFHDFEDAIQCFAATEAGINLLITRNKKDYARGEIEVCTAEEFLSTFEEYGR